MRSFGTTSRIGYDSEKFYSRKMFRGRGEDAAEHVENDIGGFADTVMRADSRNLRDIPDSCVHLMVTSPPYNVGKEYDEDLDVDEYLDMLGAVFAETHRLLVGGGRACINVANVGRRPYIPYHALIIQSMLGCGFHMRGEVIWDKGAGAGSSTAWGSWRSASNPTLRDVHEYVLVFCKGRFGRDKRGRTDTIGRDEFLEYTKSVWRFPPERAKKVGHPAPFPVELPRRCVQLYTFEGDVVFDPFCGSGSTGVAAAESGRRYLMVDSDGGYVETARRRIAALRPLR